MRRSNIIRSIYIIADNVERNPCIHKCEASVRLQKGLSARTMRRAREGNERSPFGRFVQRIREEGGRGKRVIRSNERHKNILRNARTKKREVDVMGNQL